MSDDPRALHYFPFAVGNRVFVHLESRAFRGTVKRSLSDFILISVGGGVETWVNVSHIRWAQVEKYAE